MGVEPEGGIGRVVRDAEEQNGVGRPDNFQRLWTPHRMAYIKGENKPSGGGAGDDCPFCEIPKLTDEEGLITARGEVSYAVLNLYPYNSGHLMIAPYAHGGDLPALAPAVADELFVLTRRAVAALQDEYRPDGFNVGMNLGRVAGAGIPGHLHVHVVPRWGGDTNFMPVVGETKVLPEMLSDTFERLRRAFAAGR